ncbi:hypothetical protein BN2476_180008 [Paraburkholderia piptadeniae]|uniref:Uncharacterized protein n=1 Tax=Paraburkholderia piptadeniae TaxID=1701573 RepID=A0A1N7RVC1_9BURK|nr:hypothetical protein BN2476_180008 [Paraburkholderia piptadeniae]
MSSGFARSLRPMTDRQNLINISTEYGMSLQGNISVMFPHGIRSGRCERYSPPITDAAMKAAQTTNFTAIFFTLPQQFHTPAMLYLGQEFDANDSPLTGCEFFWRDGGVPQSSREREKRQLAAWRLPNKTPTQVLPYPLGFLGILRQLRTGRIE